MITFKNELPMNHERSIQKKVYKSANELLVKEFKAETSNEVYKKEGMNIEQAIETSWKFIEEHLKSEGLEMECSNEV